MGMKGGGKSHVQESRETYAGHSPWPKGFPSFQASVGLAYRLWFKQIQTCLSLKSISLSLSFSHQLPLHVSPPVPTCPFARYDLPFIFRCPTEEDLRNGLSLTIATRVEKMLSQVTAKHPFLLHLPLFRFLWAGLHQGTKEGDELAAFLWHCTTGRNQFISGLAQLDKAEHNTFYRARQNGKNINKYIEKRIFSHPCRRSQRPGWMGPWAVGSSLTLDVEVGWQPSLRQGGWNLMILELPSIPSHTRRIL